MEWLHKDNLMLLNINLNAEDVNGVTPEGQFDFV